ncbi:hypothetical protein [Lentibacillus sp. JNUCC-1]|uniref:hypothetical protein n=1 Tax=Lentibacillus sp. JNUCC-1 TaxID=2654513 RepID=UPI0012E745BF|nr:hypothetical protein [Lentibacillus sp. JNUCC-1]
MKRSTVLIASSMLVCMLVLGGCAKTEKEILTEAEENAQQAFQAGQGPNPNYQGETFSFFVPAELEVMDADAHNVVLEDDEHTYIVFYNSLENKKSTLNYDAAQNPGSLLYQSFEAKDRFGYIRILPDDEEQFEIQVGIGGAKITTITDLQALDDQAAELMKMARSIVEEEPAN